MKIRIYLKSGVALPDLVCDEFEVERNRMTGTVQGYSFKGGCIPRPLYVDLSEVAAIVRVDEEE